MQHSYGQYKAGVGSAGLDKYKSYPASPAVMQHSYGQYKAGFGSAGLDKYKSYPASPAVLSDECIGHFYISLESQSASLFTAIMGGNYSYPLLAVSLSVSFMTCSVVMTSSDMPSSSSKPLYN